MLEIGNLGIWKDLAHSHGFVFEERPKGYETSLKK